jgi:hypothetical protein
MLCSREGSDLSVTGQQKVTGDFQVVTAAFILSPLCIVRLTLEEDLSLLLSTPLGID